MTAPKMYFRPLVQIGPAQPAHAHTLAGGWAWFTDVEVLQRGKPPHILPAQALEMDVLAKFTVPREDVAGLKMGCPNVMGILNATPDSFSDGGQFAGVDEAIEAGLDMLSAGAQMLDIGGESTRPGSVTIDPDEEIQRVVPIIAGLRAAGATCPISIDTRKAVVAEAAFAAGATMVNEVSGFTYDPDLAPYCAAQKLPICVMHALGDPATMQENPHYDNVLLDVYDFLDHQIAKLAASGIPRSRMVADPGIGFGKTLDHNLALLARLGLFHGLGIPILLGASRKRFIGTISGAAQAADRASGSLGVALAALGHGVQVLRVHDVQETVAAISLWSAASTGRTAGSHR